VTSGKNIIENSPFAMAATEGPEHNLLFVNAAFCALQGKTADEIIGHPISDALSGAGAHDVIDFFDEVYSGQVSGFVNTLHYSEPGRVLDYKSYLAWGLTAAEGDAHGLVIQVNDYADHENLHGRDRTFREVHDLHLEIRQINERLIISAVNQHSANAALEIELTRNRAIAEALQYSLLWPQPEKRFPGMRVAAFYEPAAGDALVGGDFFDAFKLSDQSVMLVVGDVTGKGLKAAARTVEVTFALRAFAQDYRDPSEILGRLNRFICDYHNDDDDSIGNALIVLSLIVVNPFTGVMRVASAGAEPPLIVRASGDVEELYVSGLILGIDRETVYGMRDMSLDTGDTLLMTTDGITEARQGRGFFGYARLLETAQRAAESGTPYEIGKAVLEAVREYTGGRFSDDVCLLLVRRADD